MSFADGQRFELPFEYLRVHSPSAEVKGHGPGQEVLVLGKEHVGIKAVEPIGQYAVRLVFDDGHDTGLYTWGYLYELGSEHAAKWAQYQERVRPGPALQMKKAGWSTPGLKSFQDPRIESTRFCAAAPRKSNLGKRERGGLAVGRLPRPSRMPLRHGQGFTAGA